jgi:hypothetical protein
VAILATLILFRLMLRVRPGWGARGGNFASRNVGYKSLLNIQRLARRQAA